MPGWREPGNPLSEDRLRYRADVVEVHGATPRHTLRGCHHDFDGDFTDDRGYVGDQDFVQHFICFVAAEKEYGPAADRSGQIGPPDIELLHSMTSRPRNAAEQGL